ncbi:aspartyl/Asparaginyl beta-hydroxylase domain-containing protein [Phthorimaea operculella]|nr:aspartyl/Asparaginyl beta-hydroxylase domain-containing protein [Phthorimaea operculella]
MDLFVRGQEIPGRCTVAPVTCSVVKSEIAAAGCRRGQVSIYMVFLNLCVQMDLFVRGQEIPGRCAVAPVTCSVVKSEIAAAGCRRGQVKFSVMAAGTHVRPHVGPTNCRLRMHLGLSNTKDTFLRVDQETRQWQEGKVLLFDDSFEHEVWHNGTADRLVLIVDVWHPDLTPQERRTLPPI